jgi:hypothetical protein
VQQSNSGTGGKINNRLAATPNPARQRTTAAFRNRGLTESVEQNIFMQL